MDIFTVIKKEHRAVQALLKDLTETTERAVKKRTTLLREIAQELVSHNHAEEMVFYPKLNSDREERVLIFEAKDEHTLGAATLQELEQLDCATEEWAAKAKVLKDLVDHHIEEEEGEIHPLAKKLLSKDEALELATQFQELKQKFKAQESEKLPELKQAS